MNDLNNKTQKRIDMTDKVTKEDILTHRHPQLGEAHQTQAARIKSLGMLAIAQSIDGLVHQLKRMIDDECGGPENTSGENRFRGSH